MLSSDRTVVGSLRATTPSATPHVRVPLFVRGMALLQCLAFCINFMLPGRADFANNPSRTVGSLHVWRLVTSAFFTDGRLGWRAICIFVLLKHGSVLERQHGTARFATLCASLSLAANVVFTGTALLLSTLRHSPLPPSYHADGLWMFTLMLLIIFASGITHIDCAGIMTVPARALPWLIAMLVFLVKGSILDSVCAVLVAEAYSTGRIRVLKPDSPFMKRADTRSWVVALRLPGREGYIAADALNVKQAADQSARAQQHYESRSGTMNEVMAFGLTQFARSTPRLATGEGTIAVMPGSVSNAPQGSADGGGEAAAFETLLEMGFDRDAARSALQNGGSVQAAIEALTSST